MPHTNLQSCRYHGFVPYRGPGIRRRILRRRDPPSGSDRQKPSTIRFRTCASLKEESKEDVLGDLEEQFPFAPPKRPRFQAFVGQTEAGRLLLAFRHKCGVKGGTLLLRPLQEDNLSPATELLAESFAEAVGYMMPYRGFLKRQIREYLYSHLAIAPKAVVMEAILLEEGSEAEADLVPPMDSPALILRKEEGAVSWLDEATYLGQEDVPQVSEQEAASTSEANPLQTPAPLGSIDGQEANATSIMESYFGRSERESAPEGFQEAADSAEDRREVLAGNQEGNEERTSDVANVPGESSGESTASGSGDEAEAPCESSDEAEAEEAERRRGRLVGTVELSFSSSTRTRSLTLNPPEDGAYLCNMAVGVEFQRRGYARAMLAAVEDVIQLTGFRRVWLHVRLKDEAARGLYQQAGFQVEKEDCWLVSLWDERRNLLSKFIPRRKDTPEAATAQDSVQEEEAMVPEY